MDRLSSDEANQLWEHYRGDNPHGREALDQLYRALRKPLLQFCQLKGATPNSRTRSPNKRSSAS